MITAKVKQKCVYFLSLHMFVQTPLKCFSKAHIFCELIPLCACRSLYHKQIITLLTALWSVRLILENCISITMTCYKLIVYSKSVLIKHFPPSPWPWTASTRSFFFKDIFQSCLHQITTLDLGGSSTLREHQIIHPATAPSAGLFIVHHTHINLPCVS